MVNFIRYEKVFGLYEKLQPFLKYSLPLEEKLPARNILVIAPHADDESIGCGATVHMHVNGGGKASVVFCTSDGQTRDNEAKEALKTLGVTDPIFLGYKTETLKSENSLPVRLSVSIEERQPEIVFVPFFMDNHEDHRAVNEALISAYRVRKTDFMIYAYPVWFPLYPNLVVDISAVWEIKKKAIECYKTQLATRDYVKMARSLGEYWGEVKGRGIKVAETFFKATAREYLSLADRTLNK